MQPVIIVFAKAPVPGRVKTRLLDRLGPAGCTHLHRAMVSATLEIASQISNVALELHTDEPCPDWPHPRFARRLQAPGGLQLKLLHALETALDAGHPQALILGSDSPTLPASHITALLAAQADVALGPTDDGGFWGIAARRTHLTMFDGVAWSTAQTLDQTAAAIGRAGLTAELGLPWYDVDDPATLERLLRERPDFVPLD